MSWTLIQGGSKGVRVVFEDKTFLDFKGKRGQVLTVPDRNNGTLSIGSWDADGDWVTVARFQPNSYLYIIPIP